MTEEKQKTEDTASDRATHATRTATWACNIDGEAWSNVRATRGPREAAAKAAGEYWADWTPETGESVAVDVHHGTCSYAFKVTATWTLDIAVHDGTGETPDDDDGGQS